MKKDISWLIGWIADGLAFLVFLALGFLGGFRAASDGGGPFGLLAYYAQAFGVDFFKCLDQLFLLACLFVTFLAFYGIMRRFLFLFLESIHSKMAAKVDLSGSPWRAVRAAAKRLGGVLLDFLPSMVLLLLLSLIFSEANGLDKSRLADLGVIAPEHFFTGTYIFAWFGSFHWPHPIIEFIIGCFMNVATVVILSALYVGYVTPRVFREMLTAFAIGMMILAACWLAVPALSPQDRFIDDVYKLPVPTGLADVVANYHPQPEIQDFLTNIRVGKSDLPNLPTSTIPSAHIFWLGLAGYYFFKSKKWLGWIALPFVIASGFGTVLLAQHYLLDVIASLVVVAVSVWAAKRLAGERLAIRH
jgi:membrane-associated phospholipid phosphatase